MDQMGKDKTDERREVGGEGAKGKAANHVEPGRGQPGEQRTRAGTSGGEAAMERSVESSRRKQRRRRQESTRGKGCVHESQGPWRERTRRAREGKREEKEKQTRGTWTGTSGEAKHPDWNIRGAEARDWSVRGSSGLGLDRPGLRKKGDTVAENNGEEHMNKGKDQMRKDTTKESQEAGGERPDGKAAKHVEPGREQPGKQRTRTGTSGGEAALDGSVRGSRRKTKRRRQETARRASTRTGEGGERGQEEQEAGSERRRRRMRRGWAHGTRTRVARATRWPQGTRTAWEAAQERGAGAGGERPVLGAQNGPRMDEDPVGPRHRVAGGPVGYKHGTRDGMGPHNSPGD